MGQENGHRRHVVVLILILSGGAILVHQGRHAPPTAPHLVPASGPRTTIGLLPPLYALPVWAALVVEVGYLILLSNFKNRPPGRSSSR